ncbi:MAG: hypothetical protein HZA04_07625 [Nitrospinae bacterium]|nr:hypothetical protein [Nitrospinota bacterium]
MNPISVLTSFPHGIAVFGQDLKAAFINPAFCEMFRLAPNAQSAAPELFAHTPEITAHLRKLLAEGQSYINHDFALEAPEGAKRTVALFIHTIDFGEAQTGACVIAQENLGKRELHREFEKEEKMAALSLITAGLAHEIKNPLSGIRGAAQLIGKENAELAEYSNLIIAETDRINSLVSELMDIGTERKIKKSKINIHRILDDILYLQEAGLAQREIRAVRDYDPSLPPVMVDADRLKQTFINLVKNAVEAMPKGGDLKVRTRTALDPAPTIAPQAKKGMMMSIEIVDSGNGIPPEVAKHLFTPFNTSKRQGTGLGLVLTLKIVRDHGGVLTLENNPGGKGATARVLIPLR